MRQLIDYPLGQEVRRREYFEWPKPSVVARLTTRVNSLLNIAPAAIDYPHLIFFDANQYHPDFIDWGKLTEGNIVIMAARATSGPTYVDPDFEAFWSAAVAAGVFVMPYHLFRCNYTAASQWAHFNEVIQPLLDATGGVVFPPAGDFETTDGMMLATRQARIKEFLDTINSEYREPATYSSPYLWDLITGSMDMPYIGWEAHWTSADMPQPINGWDPTKLLFWQRGIYKTHAWIEPIPGITDMVDSDLMFGTEADAEALAGVAPEMYIELTATRTFYNDETTTAPVVMTRNAGFKIKYEQKDVKANGKTWYRCSDSVAPSQALWVIGIDAGISYVTEYQK